MPVQATETCFSRNS